MYVRYGTAMSSASVITCSLLLLMTSLISLGKTSPPAEPPIKLEFTGAKPPSPKPPIQLVKPVQPPPPPPLPRSESGLGVSWTPDNLVNGLPTDPGFGHEFVGIDNATLEVKPMQDSPAIIVSAVPPAYPSKLAQRGIEGFVDVQYDVTAAGVADNIKILQSTHRGFEPAATAATKKMRFKPRIVDGTPVVEFGLSRRFRFEMEND